MQDPSQLLQGRSRETTIARDAQGRWSQDGQPLEHPNLTRSFDRWIARAQDGRYCLKNDINWAYIALEGPPFFVRSVQLEPTDAPTRVTLVLSNGASEALCPETLRTGEDGALYCDVADGDMTARFDSNAAAQLETLIDEDEHGIYLELGGQRFVPKLVADPLARTTRKPDPSKATRSEA